MQSRRGSYQVKHAASTHWHWQPKFFFFLRTTGSLSRRDFLLFLLDRKFCFCFLYQRNNDGWPAGSSEESESQFCSCSCTWLLFVASGTEAALANSEISTPLDWSDHSNFRMQARWSSRPGAIARAMNDELNKTLSHSFAKTWMGFLGVYI